MRSINPNKPSATFAISMRYGGMARITKLPLTQEMISQLALEAQVRDMSVAELLSELIAAISKKGLVSWFLTAAGNAPKPKKHLLPRAVRRHLCHGADRVRALSA